ncbi:FixH family protein [Bacillus tianshenii]|nr:FixH family protein [Bacillus tianshenii]
MKKLSVLLLALLVVLSACGQEKQTNEGTDSLQPLEVEIKLPEEIKPNEETTISTYVSQGGEAVNDADDVQFELWKSGQDEHEMIEGEFQEDGIYSFTHTFTEEGTYYVVSHVTARDMHNMPREEFVVGSPSASEQADTESEHEHDEQSEDEEAHGHGSEVMISFTSPEQVKANEETTLSAMIMQTEQPLTEGKVRFEIWKENDHNHEYIDATEDGNGKYSAVTTFSEAGTYNINIHIEKGDIHDHTKEQLTVK